METTHVAAVVDHVGGPGIRDSWRMLAPGGTLVALSDLTMRDAAHPMLVFMRLFLRLQLWNVLPNRRHATFFSIWAGKRRPERFRAALREDLGALFALLADGTLQAPVDRVFPLSQLDDDAASDLFGQRARAARPGVALDPTTVLSVVRRLDGLPLAIELAAARVRAMSVEDIDRRLDDRFALLRGGDRTAPDRHQTLLAVIDWSWNLLRDTERRSLRWLSTFHDGFSLDGADAVAGGVEQAQPGAEAAQR